VRDSSGEAEISGESARMTPDRWRVVDAILQAALACDPDQRAAFVIDACGEDEMLRREVASLLAAHDAVTGDFLERPPVEEIVMQPLGPAAAERLAAALADALAGHYEIEREIARGGMATVYLARDLRHGRRVALKVMRDEVAAAIGAERFLEEIRVTALLQHPHILPLFDSGSAGALLWYVMPFVEGETLRSRLARDGRLPIDEAVRLAGEIADALEHANARGIVHRDVKPENVLLQDGHALVADFGIALALEHAGGDRLTRTGLTLGTPQYMAPEQAAGERAIDARVDVYALGAVLHEMIAGEPPFGGGSRQLVLQRMLLEPPTALTTRSPDASPQLAAAVRRAMAKRPEDRFPSAAAFAAAIVARPDHPGFAPGGPASNYRRELSDASAAYSPKRLIAARAAVYMTLAGIGAGLMGGWGLAHSPLTDRWRENRQAIQAPASAPAIAGAPMDASQGTAVDGLSLVVVDRAGRLQQTISANRPWTPRFSPDGHRVAYGAFGAGRGTSDLWITDLDAGTTQRFTDDDADSNDPQWSPDGAVIAYSVSAPGGKDLASRPVAGGEAHVLASRDGTQFPSDWPRQGKALLVTDESGADRHDILVQPANGALAQPYAATTADETAARLSPDGRWIAYTSDESGRAEVYLDSYPRPSHRIVVSRAGGIHPVWRGDGRELYYWRGDVLVAVAISVRPGGEPPAMGARTELFRAPYQGGLNTMYDASPDGERFVIVQHH
jgi:eukaryotic-like serine/threonine-protein kinase